MKIWYLAAVIYVLFSNADALRRRGSSKFDQNVLKKSPQQHRDTIGAMSASGQHMSIIEYLEALIKGVEHLNFDDELPSLYSYLGVAYHDAGRSEDAIMAFKNCSRYHTRRPDPRCLMNEAEASMHVFRLTDAIKALEKAVAMNFTPAYAKLLRAKGWTDDWKDFEKIGSDIREKFSNCLKSPSIACEVESGVEYLDASNMMRRYSAMTSPHSQPREPIESSFRAQLWSRPYPKNKRIKVGLVSSDFGVHPVATLIRSFVQYVDTSKIELYCFALNDKRSWWGINISLTAEHFINLASTNTQDAAMEIALEKIDILIDLNGGTLNSGLSLMAHKPAPVQMSYIGFPVSTGASFIDYYLADNVALPAEERTQFIEKLALIPTTSIVNDYAQIRGGLLDYNYDNRAPRSMLQSDVTLDEATFLFATLSNFQKICSSSFHTWMNILNRMPGSKMLFIAYEGSKEAIQNIRSYARHFGLPPDSLSYAGQLPWIYHLTSKTALDMILDTRLKNGHTTGLDGLWAGVPTVTLGGMSEMGRRCGESFAAALDMYTGLAFSLKEYEDIAIEFAKDPKRLRTWRESLGRKRVTESLFDSKYHTRNIESILQAVWEAKHVSVRTGKRYNVVSLPKREPRKILETYQVDDEDPSRSQKRETSIPRSSRKVSTSQVTNHEIGAPSKCAEESSSRAESYAPLPPDLFDKTPLMLNLGGYVPVPGWANVNIQPKSYGAEHNVEVIRQLGDLFGFPNNSVDAIYCSHSLEHVKMHDLEDTLNEWHRVLKPGGLLFVSVPDLKIMARLLLDSSLDVQKRWFVVKMIYGAQFDQYDFHYLGFDEDILPALLHSHGFCDFKRVKKFNIVQDTSSMEYQGVPISLNMVSRKCGYDPDDEDLLFDPST